jgi:hypothetical protein
MREFRSLKIRVIVQDELVCMLVEPRPNTGLHASAPSGARHEQQNPTAVKAVPVKAVVGTGSVNADESTSLLS